MTRNIRWTRWCGALVAALLVLCAGLRPVVAAPIKGLLCTGDYGMWAQDRVPLITGAIDKFAPGKAVWESEQSYNFVKKLEAPGWAERFDVIAMGDIGIGQMTPASQAALVRFVNNGGGLIYVMQAKSGIEFKGSREAVPMPLESILPFRNPAAAVAAGAYPYDMDKLSLDAQALKIDAPFFKGLDFSATPFITGRKPEELTKLPPLLIERAQGKGRVLLLYGAFGAGYKYIAYATYEKLAGGWDTWPQLGDLWTRVVDRAAQNSPILSKRRAQVDASVADAPLSIDVAVDATRAIDDIRAADFSIVALQQLYNEDGGANEALFLALNPRDWFDRRTQEVLPNTQGVKADKPAFFRDFNIKGIYMADNSYGSYGQWDDKKYAEQTEKAIADQKKYAGILQFFQAGNEPPLDENYVKFHKRFVTEVLKGAPDYKVVGPNKAFNISGVNPKEMQFYIDQVGATTDVLNWHTYAQPPSTVLAEARYWSDKATGKLRTPGQARVMFTESDAWNTRDSQFNYLMQRAYAFLPEPRIIANFQYCMDPRSEGGPYRFGILQPEGEMSANYNGYWIWRDLRGKMVQSVMPISIGISGQLSKAALEAAAANTPANHVHVISSSADGGKTVTSVVYYDTGYFNGARRANQAKVNLQVKLPPGRYTLQRSEADWDTRKVNAVSGVVQGTTKVAMNLAPCQAIALTWTRHG